MTPAPQGLPKTVRLLKPQEFSRVYDRRWSAAAGPLVLYAAPNEVPGAPARLGLSVSRRIGNAVVRNRWKRRLREAFRAVRRSLPPGTDFVIVVRSGQAPVGAAGGHAIAESIVALARRVGARPGYGRR